MHAILLLAVLATIAAPDSTPSTQNAPDGAVLQGPRSHAMPSTPGDSQIDPRMPMMMPNAAPSTDSTLQMLQRIETGRRETIDRMPTIPGDTMFDPNMPVAGEKEFLTPDQQPFPIKRVDPRTPGGFQGKATVWVKALVDTAGIVQDVRVVKSDDNTLNIPSMAAARQWRFRSAMVAKKPVQIWVTIPFHFNAIK
jgi:TonB family protein